MKKGSISLSRSLSLSLSLLSRNGKEEKNLFLKWETLNYSLDSLSILSLSTNALFLSLAGACSPASPPPFQLKFTLC